MKTGIAGDRLHATHILEAGERIERYLAGLTREEFVEDAMRQDATIRNFQVMGEAAKRVSPETRAAHPEVPWSEFARFRDVLAAPLRRDPPS